MIREIEEGMVLYASRRINLVLLSIILMLLAGCASKVNKTYLAEQLYNEGQLLITKGKQESALKKFKKSLALSREINFPIGVAHNLNELAIYYTAQKEYKQARFLLGEAKSIYQQAGMAPEMSKVLNNLAQTYYREGRFQTALEQYSELLAWDQKTGNKLGEAITMYNMGKIHEQYLGNKEEARRQYTIALEYFLQLNKDEYSRTVKQSLVRVEDKQ